MSKTNRWNVLGLVLWLWVMLVGLVPAQEVRTLMVRSNGVLAAPTNFFAVNSNLLREVVGAGGTTGTNTFRVLNVKELGAAGDGSTDDTAAIQSALDRAATNVTGLADVYFPPGTYKVTSTLVVLSNDFAQQLKAATGPVRLVGNGSTASRIISYVTNGATVSLVSSNVCNVGVKFERLGIIGPQARDFTLTNWSIGISAGFYDDTSAAYGVSQYRGQNIILQDVAVDGFGAAVTATNVWGFTVDNSTFHSNRFFGLCFSKTHSAFIRNSLIRGVDAAGRLTGTGIAFIAPKGSDTSWGFGDTAMLTCNNILFTTNAVYNDELHLYDNGGNYQFAQTFIKIRSGQRTNTVNQKWHPWATLVGVIFCDSASGYLNGGDATAQCETDSYAAPWITLVNFLGDVCRSGRSQWNVIGATPSGSGNSGYITFGGTEFAQPQIVGGAAPSVVQNMTNSATWYTTSNLVRAVTASMVTNNASGVALVTPTFYPSMQIESDALGSQGVTLLTEDTGTGSRLKISDSYTTGAEYLRADDTGLSSAVPFVGNASGMTNFSRAALAASGAVTNGQSSFAAGTVVASGAGFIGDASSLTNVPSLANGTKSFYFDNPNTWRTPQDLGGSNITALGGTFTGNGRGVTNLNLNGYGITNAIISGTSYSGTGTNLSGRMHTGGHAETNFSTGSWSLLSNANFTLGGSNALGITLNGASGSQTNTGTISASNFVGVARIVAGAATYVLTDNTEKFLGWSGSVSSSSESFARAPMAIGGTFGQLYFSTTSLGAGTNVTVKIYTNGVYCGLGVTVRGTGSAVATNELVTTTGVVPAGAEASLGLQSNYNGVHPTIYWKWSWVATK